MLTRPPEQPRRRNYHRRQRRLRHQMRRRRGRQNSRLRRQPHRRGRRQRQRRPQPRRRPQRTSSTRAPSTPSRVSTAGCLSSGCGNFCAGLPTTIGAATADPAIAARAAKPATAFKNVLRSSIAFAPVPRPTREHAPPVAVPRPAAARTRWGVFSAGCLVPRRVVGATMPSSRLKRLVNQESKGNPMLAP